MAVLISPVVIGALLLGGCSLVLDSDELAFPDPDVQPSDTTPDPDVQPSDTTPQPDTSPDSVLTNDTDTLDTDPDPTLIVRHSGEAGCTLEYRTLISCPNACTWKLVVDASQSVGYGAFAWRFSATNTYRISPATATGARVTLTLQPPDCDIITTPTVGPAKVLAEVSTDGGPYRLGATIDFAVQQVGQCTGTDLCPAPVLR